ncbi:MAG: AAA family ATPase [Coriobacteriales bacterium]|jgi:hypothetical protein|nr:AAA family ATPase [Coriobacteriales bacterium]
MSSNLSIHGHAYTRVFTYSEGGLYREFEASGGVYLLRDMLSPGAASSRNTSDGLDKVYYELQRFEDKQDEQGYWACVRDLGRVEGSGEKTATLGFGNDLVIWDEGLGGLSVLDGNSAASDESLVVPDNPVAPDGSPALPDDNPAVLWASDKTLPDRDQFAKIAANCFVFLNADVLRTAGALISRQISWERTATELIWQLQNNPALSYLLKAPHVLVSFAEDGAVHIQRTGGRAKDEAGNKVDSKTGSKSSDTAGNTASALKAELVLTHGGGEGTLRNKARGGTDDTFILMTAGLAKQFSFVLHKEKPLQILPVLKTAEALLTSGYTVESLQNSDYPSSNESDTAEVAFEIPVKPGQSAIDPDNWCISDSVDGKRVFDTAFEYVIEGARAIKNLPQLSFGALTTVDRWEIEAFQNIRNLIVGYASSPSVRPLSLAVFGSPGSGKSFGVTQIAKNVLPGKVEKLEFNVSQFISLSDLSAAFQKVRDVILEGKLPLVFFDEFDSDRDGTALGWIKSFLAPMQDGMFKDASGEHPLGKCILVFAGGTAASFEEFTAPLSSERPEEQQAFKNIKGPDFVSRLRGTINVLGPNPKDNDDTNYILRRALLLRSLCERKLNIKKDVAPISKNIIWAMLLVPQYKHGARSMEAILDMSRLEDNVWEPVSLPFYSQLSLHVDADAFIKLVLREVILNSYLEQLAQAIHADFRKKATERDYADAPYNISWEQLPEDIKDSNREQAASFAEKLSAIGYSYDAGDTPFASVEAFTNAEVLLLAQNEHVRWMKDREEHGWMQGNVRDNKKKIHPLLVPWEELPKAEQQKDIDIAENIIPLLTSIGLRVYKTI